MNYQDNNTNETNASQQPPEQTPEAPKMIFQGYENIGFVMPTCKTLRIRNLHFEINSGLI